jgi:hypothetical protein
MTETEDIEDAVMVAKRYASTGAGVSGGVEH